LPPAPRASAPATSTSPVSTSWSASPDDPWPQKCFEIPRSAVFWPVFKKKRLRGSSFCYAASGKNWRGRDLLVHGGEHHAHPYDDAEKGGQHHEEGGEAVVPGSVMIHVCLACSRPAQT